MSDSSPAAAHRHVVFIPLCGASPLLSAVLDLLISHRQAGKEEAETPPDSPSRYLLLNLRRKKEWWGRRSRREEGAQMELIQEEGAQGVCRGDRAARWRRDQSEGVPTSERHALYMQGESGEGGARDEWRRRGGFWEVTFLQTSSSLTSSGSELQWRHEESSSHSSCLWPTSSAKTWNKILPQQNPADLIHT